MNTYVYETIPQTPGAKTHYYEIQQNPDDALLTKHPETAEPVRRVVLGELGERTVPERDRPAEGDSGSSCGCGCGRLPWLK